VKEDIGSGDIETLMKGNFDGYQGDDLIMAIRAGYIETRYPSPTDVSDNFPIEGTDLYWNPLSSSGITKFIYAVCNLSYHRLTEHIDFSDVLNRFKERFGHRESFRRFNNLFWDPRSKVSL